METPAIVIDRRRMRRNIASMAAVADKHGVKLRPHAKTHKIAALAHEQIAAGAAGITVAKVAEAEVMAAHGVRDIFIAYPIVVPSKIERVVALSRENRIIVGVDSLEGATALSTAAVREGVTIEARLEIDTGLKRTGVTLDEALELAKRISSLPGIVLSGIFTYKGALYQGASTLDLAAAGREEGELMASVAKQLRESGIPIVDVSVGSTPTGVYAAQVPGVTEIRPGTYIFYDAMQVKLGVCEHDDCAGRVVVTVVSKPAADLIVVDGGSKTFATDVQPNQPPLNLKGFGIIEGYPDAVLERMNEEHGMIRMPSSHTVAIGDRLTIVPNHICSTINLHNEVYVQDEDGGLERLSVLARGLLQ